MLAPLKYSWSCSQIWRSFEELNCLPLGAGRVVYLMVGLYVGKCFEGVKRRPAFIIAEEKGGA